MKLCIAGLYSQLGLSVLSQCHPQSPGMKTAADKKNEEKNLIKTGNYQDVMWPKPLNPEPKLQRQEDLFESQGGLVYKVPRQSGMCSKTLFQKTNNNKTENKQKPDKTKERPKD